MRFRLEVWQQGESVFVHDYSAADRDVLVQFPVGTLGDTIGWFPYAVKFKEQHGCRLTCGMAEKLIPLFRDAYPDITFLTHEEVKPDDITPPTAWACSSTTRILCYQPCDFRHVGLHRTAGYILGVDPTEVPPRIAIPDDSRPIAEPYVCIAVQSTTQSKYWNNPTGWHEIIGFLKEAGYRVICIDQKRVHGTGSSGTTSRTAPRTRPAIGRLPSARAGSSTAEFLCRPFERTVLARLGVRHAGGDDLRFHSSDQRIRHALSGDQLSRLQQLAGTTCATASTIAISCGARGTRIRRGNSSARA